MPALLAPLDDLPADRRRHAEPRGVTAPVEPGQPATDHATADRDQVGSDGVPAHSADEQRDVATGGQLAVQRREVVRRRRREPVTLTRLRHHCGEERHVALAAQMDRDAVRLPLVGPSPERLAESAPNRLEVLGEVDPDGPGGSDVRGRRPETVYKKVGAHVLGALRGLDEQHAKMFST
jgi:hypothetical protein